MNADCADTDGSFTCACRDGYSGTGTVCTSKKVDRLHNITPIMSSHCLQLIVPSAFVLSTLSQILMNAVRSLTAVMQMLSVQILLVALFAPVKMDLEGMDSHVLVRDVRNANFESIDLSFLHTCRYR